MMKTENGLTLAENVVQYARINGREVCAFVQSATNSGIVLCKLKGGEEFATWAVHEDGATYWGHYFPARAYGEGFSAISQAWEAAILDFQKRAFGE